MNTPLILNVVGLVAGFAGSVLLFRYGLPPDVKRGGHGALLLEQKIRRKPRKRFGTKDLDEWE